VTAATTGRTTRAKAVQASQVFSQAHLRAYFMGNVKLALVTPAMTRIAIPYDAVLMEWLPSAQFQPLLCDICPVQQAKSTTGISGRVPND
jgi:hypothetical protein